VISSGAQTSGKKSAAPSCASTLASILSVLIFADTIARVRIGFDTVTRPACSANRSRIAHVIAVDSKTTSSPGPNDSANRPSWSVSIRRSRRSAPFSITATSAKRFCTSSATVPTTTANLLDIDETTSRGADNRCQTNATRLEHAPGAAPIDRPNAGCQATAINRGRLTSRRHISPERCRTGGTR
jgi:hypothetical protein